MRNRSIVIFLIILSTLASGCSRDEVFKKLLQNPAQYHGKEIEIRGILHFRFEDSAIYFSRNSKNRALWVDFQVDELSNIQELDGRRVRLKGVFDHSDKGHLNQYFGALKDSKVIE
jgi:hypothetical protein